MIQTFFIYKDRENHGGICDVASVQLNPEYFGGSSWGDQTAEMEAKESEEYCVAWMAGEGMSFKDWLEERGYSRFRILDY